MIVAAAICPPAPLLVPGLADRLAGQVGELRAACTLAASMLREVGQVLILSAAREGSAAGVLLPGDPVPAAGMARSDRPVVEPVRLPGGSAVRHADGGDDAATPHRAGAAAPGSAPGGAGDAATAHDRAVPPVTVGTAVGARLLIAAGVTAPTSALQIAAGAGSRLADSGRTGLLVMADGAACHGEHAPGAPDPRSESFDADLVTALRSGDPATLAATCERNAGLATELRADTLPALAALAALTADNGTARAEILHYSAPFGVGYPVATWQWD